MYNSTIQDIMVLDISSIFKLLVRLVDQNFLQISDLFNMTSGC